MDASHSIDNWPLIALSIFLIVVDSWLINNCFQLTFNVSKKKQTKIYIYIVLFTKNNYRYLLGTSCSVHMGEGFFFSFFVKPDERLGSLQIYFWIEQTIFTIWFIKCTVVLENTWIENRILENDGHSIWLLRLLLLRDKVNKMNK